MRKVKSPWKAGAVLVCTNERAPDAPKASCGQERGSELRAWLKDRIKSKGLKHTILSCRTSCLDVCSPLGVTVAIVPEPDNPHGIRRTLVVDPATEKEELWAQIEHALLGTAAPDVPDLRSPTDEED